MILAVPPPATSAAELEPAPLVLPPDLRLTPDQFECVCEANPEAVLELAADGHLLAMTPTGGDTGARNGEIFFQIKAWVRAQGGWKAFDSSTGFRLPDDAVLSPDTSLVALDRWHALTSGIRSGGETGSNTIGTARELLPFSVISHQSRRGSAPSKAVAPASQKPSRRYK